MKSSVLSIALTLLIVVSGILALPSGGIVSPVSAASPHRLGFWLQEADITACTWQGGYQQCGAAHPAQLFFNSMFLTPPYPSSLEVMIFAVLQDQTNNNGCTAASGSYIKGSEQFWGDLATLANSYPNIQLIYEIAFNAASSTYGLSCFQSVAQYFSQYPSVYGIGIEGEYTHGVSAAQVQQAMNTVTSGGKQFINYYVTPSLIPSGGYDISHTNFPGGDSGGYDQVGSLSAAADSHLIGLDSGYYYPFPFPSSVTCPIGSNSINAATAGWNQCVEQTEISVALQQPPVTREFLELDPAFSTSSFTGLSGQSTDQMWDNPALRNWVWTDPNYALNFILSNGASPPPTTTSTSQTQTTTSQTQTTTSQTLTTTSTTTTTTSSGSTTSGSVIVSTDSSSYLPGSFVNWFVTGLNPSTTYSTRLALIFANGTEIKILASYFSPTAAGTFSGTFQVPAYPKLATGFVKIEDPYAATAGLSPAFSITSPATTTTTTSSTTSSTQTITNSMATSSTSTSSTQTTSQTTSTVISTQSGVTGYTLSILGGCPSAGAGSYAAGSMATVQFSGTCGRGGGSGLRVTSWSVDGGTRTTIHTNGTSSISIAMNGPHTLNLYTIVQYQLSLDYGAQSSLLSITPPSIPSDNYWYDSGTPVTFIGEVVLPTFNIAGWALDGANAVPVSGVSTFTSSFTMSQSHLLVAFVSVRSPPCGSNNCTKTPTFDVTVKTNTNLPSGAWVDGGYYPKSVTFAWPEGSVHNLTAAEGIRQSLTRTYFTGWSGESKSLSPTVMLSVNESGSLIAEYSKEYLVSLAFTDASGGSLVPQSVTVKGPLGTNNLGANLTAWTEAGVSYRITSAMWMNWNVVMGNDSTFSVSQPGSLSFSLGVYIQTIKVTDAYNLPLQGATVNVTALNGAKQFHVTDGTGTARFRVPVGLFTAAIGYLGVNNQITTNSEGSHSYNVSFLLSYPLLATVGSVSAITGVFAFLMLRKKPAGDPRFFSD